MSTILKALRRLEEDKSGTRERPLREEILVAHRERRRGVGIALGCALLVVGVGLGLFWQPLLLAPGGEKEATPAGDPGPSGEASRERSAGASPARVANVPSISPPVADTPSRAAASESARSSPSVPDPAGSKAAIAAAAPARSAPSEAQASAAAVPTRPAPSERAPVARAARAPRLPPIVVTRTVWHPEPGRREAVVELEGRAEPLRLREGDAVGTLVVGEIEPSGVLFLRDGVEIQARVGRR